MTLWRATPIISRFLIWLGKYQKAIADFSDEHFEISDFIMPWRLNLKDYTWCPYLQILPVIGADLNIYPCQDKAYNLEHGLVGTIRNQRFKILVFG